MTEESNRVRRILVLDDEPAVLATCRAILEKAGYEVETISTAREALVKATDSSFDVVLTDVDMPDMGGLEFIMRLRLKSCNVPCVVMSGSGDPAVERSAGVAGAAAFLAKPFTALQLLERVARAIGPTVI
jgi:CheY-like chemotaxis protein